MSRLVLSILLVAVLAGGAFANIPDAALSTVPPVLMVPNNANTLAPPQGPNVLGYSVTVNGAGGPVGGALVELFFSTAANALISWCNGADGRPVTPLAAAPGGFVTTAVAGPDGIATFKLSGGACIRGTQLALTAEVRANGIPLGSRLAVLSPDATNKSGQNTSASGSKNCGAEPSAPGGFETRVGLSDAVYLTGPFAVGTYDACADLNGSGSVTTGDAVIATQFVVNSNNCSCTP